MVLFCCLGLGAGAQEDPTLTQPVQQKKVKTVGEHLQELATPEKGEAKEPKAEQADAPMEATEEAPKQESPEAVKPKSSGDAPLHLPERKKPVKNWATQGQVGESTFFDKLISVCWSLAFISFLIWAFAKVAEKFGLKPAGVQMSSKKGLIEIIEKKRLSPGRSIMIMRVGPKVLAVAATESGYETLTEFTEEEFRQYQDGAGTDEVEATESPPPDGVTTPADIARHYLSIIPGTGGAKK